MMPVLEWLHRMSSQLNYKRWKQQQFGESNPIQLKVLLQGGLTWRLLLPSGQWLTILFERSDSPSENLPCAKCCVFFFLNKGRVHEWLCNFLKHENEREIRWPYFILLVLLQKAKAKCMIFMEQMKKWWSLALQWLSNEYIITEH